MSFCAWERSYYIPAQSLDAFIGNLVKSLKPGGHLLVDRRIPTRLHVWQNFVLRAHPLVVKLYPHLRDDLSLPRVPFRTFAQAAGDWLLRLGDYYRRRLVQILFRGRSAGVERRFRSLLGRGPEPDAIIAYIGSRLESYGLREVDAAGLIDMDQYKICRDVEGYNLRNTFVGNYFWVRVYRENLKGERCAKPPIADSGLGRSCRPHGRPSIQGPVQSSRCVQRPSGPPHGYDLVPCRPARSYLLKSLWVVRCCCESSSRAHQELSSPPAFHPNLS